MTAKRTGRPPALVPEELTPSQDARRRVVVEAFRDWVNANPTRSSDRHSTHTLGDPMEGIGITRKTINRWFPESKCGGSTWHALCFMASDLQLFDTSAPPPRFVTKCADTYREWREQDGPLQNATIAGKSLEGMSNLDLQSFIEANADELNVFTEASAVLAMRLHKRLLTNSGLQSHKQGPDRYETVATALHICSIANAVVNRVWQTRDTASRDLRMNCAVVIDAAVDAHRLLSRNPRREYAELGLLLDLRTKDLDITDGVRTPAERALTTYYRDVARALLSYDHARTAHDEVAAIETLLDALEASETVIRSDDSEGAAAQEDSLEAGKTVFLVDRIASILVAYRDEDIHDRAKACAARLLKLFDFTAEPTAATQRWDLTRLLKAAETGLSIVGPVSILRILKFRGVGEIIVARLLLQIATGRQAGPDKLPPHGTRVDMYLGGPLNENRRTQLLQRAVGLYRRAIGWLREAGVAGELREVAKTELADAEAELARHPQPDDADIKDIHTAISDLRQDLERMIVKGLLWADFESLTNIQDDSAKQAAVRLISELNEAARYLKQPEIGLRTDLPSIAE